MRGIIPYTVIGKAGENLADGLDDLDTALADLSQNCI
jgi:hypothetical protein